MARAMRAGSSSIRTMSAASMAASEPRAPIAMPRSARERTGASLMPSPTKARFSRGCFSSSRASTCATLSSGSRPARYSPMPSCAATALAAGSASPVSMTVRRTPARLRPAMALAAVGLTTSEIRMYPA